MVAVTTPGWFWTGWVVHMVDSFGSTLDLDEVGQNRSPRHGDVYCLSAYPASNGLSLESGNG